MIINTEYKWDYKRKKKNFDHGCITFMETENELQFLIKASIFFFLIIFALKFLYNFSYSPWKEKLKKRETHNSRTPKFWFSYQKSLKQNTRVYPFALHPLGSSENYLKNLKIKNKKAQKFPQHRTFKFSRLHSKRWKIPPISQQLSQKPNRRVIIKGKSNHEKKSEKKWEDLNGLNGRLVQALEMLLNIKLLARSGGHHHPSITMEWNQTQTP